MSDTYGLTSFEPSASYDPDTRSWKMYAVISLWGLTESLETLPKSGMTRNGRLFQQPVSARLIDATASSVWPTQTAHPDNSNVNGKFKNPTLGDAVRMWPTPTTQEVEHPNAELTPTGRRKAKNGNSHSLGLADAVQKWPTPQARDYKGASGRSLKGTERDLPMAVGNGGKLNPTWVEWLMGFPLGWTDLEA